jgi:hypothetical protein
VGLTKKYLTLYGDWTAHPLSLSLSATLPSHSCVCFLLPPVWMSNVLYSAVPTHVDGEERTLSNRTSIVDVERGGGRKMSDGPKRCGSVNSSYPRWLQTLQLRWHNLSKRQQQLMYAGALLLLIWLFLSWYWREQTFAWSPSPDHPSHPSIRLTGAFTKQIHHCAYK